MSGTLTAKCVSVTKINHEHVCYLRIPLGTFPEKAGSTGIMPNDLIRSKILNCKKRGIISLHK